MGRNALRIILRLEAVTLLGFGLLVAVGTGLGGYLWGEAFLEAARWHADIPGVGMVVLSTSLLFEVGVFCIVVSIAIAVVQELGGQ